jgi:glycosyltransferase involved in cell wall biosynthesis
VTPPEFDFTVVIPTFQRRALVVETVRAFERQQFTGTFEVVVVVDGSTDGTTEALRALRVPFRLTVLEHQNQGLAVTRNRGASAASGRWLLFLDDDMEAHPQLLAEHAKSLTAGADAVTGHVPLHPRSPRNALSASVEAWADDRAKHLAASPAIDFLEVIGGQLSLSKRLFDELGGFDMSFTKQGTFGNEDRDFACRLLAAGRRIVFNPDAISWQTYIVRPAVS